MEYLAVSIYIESFTVTCLKKTTSHLLIYVYAYIQVRKRKADSVVNLKKIYNIDMICEKYW